MIKGSEIMEKKIIESLKKDEFLKVGYTEENLTNEEMEETIELSPEEYLALLKGDKNEH